MKQPENHAIPAVADNLRKMIQQLFNNHLPLAVRHNSFIQNNIPEQLMVSTNQQIVASVLSSLMQLVIQHTHNSDVVIQAREYEDILFVKMNFSNLHNIPAVNYRIEKARFLSERIYGHIHFTEFTDHTAMITFSFPNLRFINWRIYQQPAASSLAGFPLHRRAS